MENELDYNELTNSGKKVNDIVLDYKNNISKDVSKEKKSEEYLKILGILKVMYKEMEEDKNHESISLHRKNFFINEMNKIVMIYDKHANLFKNIK